MESPGLTWIPTGVGSANLSYLVHHETGHQWFYGIVGNDQSAEPFTDEAAADFLARNVLGQRRASRLLDRPARPLDLQVLDSVLLRDHLHPGRQLHRRPPQVDGEHRVLGRDARLRHGQPIQADADEDPARHARRTYIAQPRAAISGRAFRGCTEGLGPRPRLVRKRGASARRSGSDDLELRRGRYGRACGEPAICGDRARHLAERGRQDRPPGAPRGDEPT